MKRLIILMALKLKNIKKHVELNITNDLALKCKFEGYNKVGKNTKFCGELGRCSYLGKSCVVNAYVGRYTSIGSSVNVVYHTHPAQRFVSTSPSFFNPTGKQNGKSYVDEFKFDEYVFVNNENKIAVNIGSDVWIGYGVTIMGGVNIADGAIIASGAVVTKELMFSVQYIV